MWVVQGFDKASEELVKDLTISDAYPDELARSVFELGPDEPPIGSLRVTPEIAGVIQPYLSESLDLHELDYFSRVRQ